MKKSRLNKNKQTKSKSFDYLILIIFILSMIMPIIAATSQQLIVQYADDIVHISAAKEHSIFDIFSYKIGTGYRPVMNLFYVIEYSLWGSEASFYYLFSGLLFSGGMIFLYLLGKTLHSRLAGLIAVLLYLFLDASFILISKINYIVSTSEILFITSALYFSIKYIRTKDKISMWLAIILSILGFLEKEPTIFIIPIVTLTYLYFRNELNKKYIIMCFIPFIYLIIEILFISPEIGVGGNDLFQRIITNAKYYFNTEIESQFKSPILLLFSLILAAYYISYNNLKTEIIICVVWFSTAISLILVTQQAVQPTYLVEANLGLVLLMGIVISESFKKIDYISGLLIIGMIIQVLLVPIQMTNMQNYNRMISDNQNTFLETMLEIKNIPESEIIFYFSDSVRSEYGGYQISEEIFKKYMCIKNMCNTNITTNYNESDYIILPSNQDIQIFQKEYPEELNKLQIIKQIKNNNDYGFILKKVF